MVWKILTRNGHHPNRRVIMMMMIKFGFIWFINKLLDEKKADGHTQIWFMSWTFAGHYLPMTMLHHRHFSPSLSRSLSFIRCKQLWHRHKCEHLSKRNDNNEKKTCNAVKAFNLISSFEQTIFFLLETAYWERPTEINVFEFENLLGKMIKTNLTTKNRLFFFCVPTEALISHLAILVDLFFTSVFFLNGKSIRLVQFLLRDK